MSERDCERHIMIIPPYNPEKPEQLGVCKNCGEGKMYDTTPPPVIVTPSEWKRQYLLQGIRTPFIKAPDFNEEQPV